MTTKIQSDEQSQLRADVAAKKAELAQLEEKLRESDNVRLSELHLQFDLPDTEALIARLRALLVSQKKTAAAAVTKEMKDAIRDKLAAKVPDEAILTEYGISKRVLGGIRSQTK